MIFSSSQKGWKKITLVFPQDVRVKTDHELFGGFPVLFFLAASLHELLYPLEKILVLLEVP